MIISGDYSQVTINFIPFWEKPPLFIWMQVASMKVFGINEFAARLPNVVAAFCTFLFLFRSGKELQNQRMGLLWVLCYAGSILPNLYFHSGIIDPWFNLFIIAALYYAYRALSSREILHYFYAGLFIGLSIMTKGPVALVLFAGIMGLFFLFNLKNYSLSFYGLSLFVGSFILIGGFWFFILLLQGKSHIIQDFIVYQVRLFQTEDAGHGGPFYYHFVVLLLGCFPASFLAIRNLSFRNRKGFLFVMMLTLTFTLLVFSIVQTKIIHYSSLCYFPISFLAADYLSRQWDEGRSLKRSSIVMCIGILIFFLISTAFSWMMRHPEFVLSHFNTDDFTKQALSQHLNFRWHLYVPSVFTLILLVFLTVAHRKKRYQHTIVGGYIGMAFILVLLCGFTAPNIARITQSTHVEFCSLASKNDVYIRPIGFKSFVPLFYGKQRKPDHEHYLNEGWLVSGSVDKAVLFTSRTERKEGILKTYSNLQILFEKGGFTFYSRKDQRSKVRALFPEKIN